MTRPRWLGIAGWATWALVVLLALGGAASRPGGMLLGAPSPIQAALVAAALAALVARLGWPAGGGGLGLLTVPVLLLVAPLPGVRALSGPPLLALALAAL